MNVDEDFIEYFNVSDNCFSFFFFPPSINRIDKSLNKSFLKEEIGKIILEDYLSDKRTNKENKKNIISFHEKLS